MGGASIAFAIWADVHLGWQDIWTSVLLEVGAGIALAGVLFLLEQVFVRAVEHGTRHAVSEQVKAQTDPLHEELRRQAARIEDLTSLASERRSAAHIQQDRTISEMARNLSWQSVSDALDVAQGVNAVHPYFRVQASADLMGPRMAIQQVVLEAGDSEVQALDLTLQSTDGAMTRRASVTWRPDESVGDILGRMTAALEAENIDVSSASFDPSMAFENLRTTLEFAVASRRGDFEHRLQGRLLELLDDDLVLTEAGIESLSHGLLVEAGSFPPAAFSKAGDARQYDFDPPGPPDGVLEEHWDQVLSVALATYPLPSAAQMATYLRQSSRGSP